MEEVYFPSIVTAIQKCHRLLTPSSKNTFIFFLTTAYKDHSKKKYNWKKKYVMSTTSSQFNASLRNKL